MYSDEYIIVLVNYIYFQIILLFTLITYDIACLRTKGTILFFRQNNRLIVYSMLK